MAAAITLLTTGCDKNSEKIVPSVAIETADDYTPIVEAEGVQTTFTLISTVDYSILTDVEWITVSPKSGVAGTYTINVTVDANPVTEDRTGTITATAGTADPQKLQIIQKGKDDALSFTPDLAFGSYYADTYTANMSEWTVQMNDAALQSTGTGELFFFDLLLASTYTYGDGLPDGTYTIDQSGKAFTVVEALYVKLTDNQSTSETKLTSGTFKVSHSGAAYTFEVDCYAESGEHYVFTYDDPDFYTQNNVTEETFYSTLTADVNPTTESAKIFYMGKDASDNTTTWYMYLCGDGLSITDDGLWSTTTKGTAVQVWFVGDISQSMDDPSGTYPLQNTLASGDAIPGYVTTSGSIAGTWYIRLLNNEYGDIAPAIDNGKVVIEKSSKGFKIEVEFTDDNTKKPHTVKTSYEGEVPIVNMYHPAGSETAANYDRALAEYYGDYYGIGLKSWTLELLSDDYTTSDHQSGRTVVLPLITTSDALFANGIPAGTYTVLTDDAEDYQNTIYEGVSVVYNNGNSDSFTFTGGTVTITRPTDTTCKVVLNLVDGEGREYTDTFEGSPYNIDIDGHEPSGIDTNRNYVAHDAYFTYFGENNIVGKNFWMIVINDDESYNTLGNFGVRVSLDLRTNSTFADGVPTGTFTMRERQSAIASSYEGLYNTGYTWYEDYTNGVTGWYEDEKTSITITKGEGDNNYTIDFNGVTIDKTGVSTEQYTQHISYSGRLVISDQSTGSSSVARTATAQRSLYTPKATLQKPAKRHSAARERVTLNSNLTVKPRYSTSR